MKATCASPQATTPALAVQHTHAATAAAATIPYQQSEWVLHRDAPYNYISTCFITSSSAPLKRWGVANLFNTGAQHVSPVRHKDNCRSSTSINCMLMRQRRDRAANTQVAFPGCSTAGCRSIRSASSPGRTSITYVFSSSSQIPKRHSAALFKFRNVIPTLEV